MSTGGEPSGPILIWGAGAIGGTLGAAFLRAGHEVVFVDAADDHVRAIEASGLSITGSLIEDTVRARAFLPADLSGRFDTIFLCVKAHHTEAAAHEVAFHLAEGGCIVSAQNGLNEYVIAKVVGDEAVVGCFVNFGADYLEPGLVHYSGKGAVVIGELSGEKTARVERLFGLLHEFADHAILTENILGFLWSKLVYGALLFATALTNDSIADVLADPAHRPALTALGREVGAVAGALGIRLEPFDGFDPLAFLPNAPAERTAKSFDDMVAHNRRSLKSHSGIWRDLAVRKRKTEVDAQLGPIVDHGAQTGVATPLTTQLIAMIQEIEDGTRPLSDSNLVELAQSMPASEKAKAI
ncbi:ketopantoate reductase family protein [Jiella mangrovi]|uniref:2-dehydropantoate 2-reductase n=1 Tax=Jiella mangrovi TaxID=2821407 RepID=A0ABS4BJX7_9HYPH|nr:2-dehydropantoate 2-reductase [Jiella mangrovi]MBP0616852.1 2-dehydropantoate 2-reductase [Jiella mangrovi]